MIPAKPEIMTMVEISSMVLGGEHDVVISGEVPQVMEECRSVVTVFNWGFILGEFT